MKKSEFAKLGIMSEYDISYALCHMRREELDAARRKSKIDKLPEMVEEALKNEKGALIKRAQWYVRNIKTNELEKFDGLEKYQYASFIVSAYQEGIVLFESYSESGEAYPGEDSDYGRDSLCSSYWIPFDEE